MRALSLPKVSRVYRGIAFPILILLAINLSASAQVSKQLNLIPYPKNIEVKQSFLALNKQQISYYSAGNFFNETEHYLKNKLFPDSKWIKGSEGNANIQLVKDEGISVEGYNLNISEKGILLKASTATGAFYGVQTLKQMLALSPSKTNLQLPFVKINDAPAFEWRGVELDVARHFFSKAYVFKFIDLLALYKFNKLHLHLSDDQGWRIEIKRYPKLTEIGAWRTYNNQDSTCIAKSKFNPDFNIPKEHIRIKDGKEEYGGFYTQDDIKEIIKYAAERSIEVIPEIDMPGHMMIATKAYPELLLDGASSGWGSTFSVPICPCKESAYTFLENVLDEIVALFPSKYIHIGADEVEKSTWKNSPLCQKLMKEEGITDLENLQSYFVSRMNKFIRSKNKTTIAWDEILEGKSDSTITVMYWRGWAKDAVNTGTNRGHKIIMTPNNPMYFDYLPNSSTLETVYNFKVIPTDISADKFSLFKGAQANIWTEVIPSKERLEFMILPRLTALSERVWSNVGTFKDYEKRLVSHFSIWDKMNLNYRLPDLTGFMDQQLIIDGNTVLKVTNPLPSVKIHYTLDGSVPTRNSPILSSQQKFTKPVKVKFASISSSGAKSEIYVVDIKKDTWKTPEANDSNKLKPGLLANFYAGVFSNTKSISGDILRKETLRNVHISDTVKLPAFGAKIKGYIRIPKQGVYNFALTCDDGGVLKIANQMVVDNDGQHSPALKSGQIALKQGFFPFDIDFIEAGGGFTLELKYSEGGSEYKPIPNEWLYQK
jgi:hexosaminidase